MRITTIAAIVLAIGVVALIATIAWDDSPRWLNAAALIGFLGGLAALVAITSINVRR